MNITILIGTCDAYSPLWKNFDILFQRYWQLPTKNILVSETEIFDNPHYITETPGTGLQWGHRILDALNNINTEYVFFILDDYYLTETFTQEFIDEHIAILEKHNAVKIMTDIDYGEPIYYLDHIEDDLYKFNMKSDYLNSIQPAIWKTDYLKTVMKSDYSPWDFEIKGNEYTKTLTPTILLKARPEHMYFNFVRIGGRISEGWEDLYVKENLE
jgi:hypothetical protein